MKTRARRDLDNRTLEEAKTYVLQQLRDHSIPVKEMTARDLSSIIQMSSLWSGMQGYRSGTKRERLFKEFGLSTADVKREPRRDPRSVRKRPHRDPSDPRHHPEYGNEGWGVFVDGYLWDGFPINDRRYAEGLVRRLKSNRYLMQQGYSAHEIDTADILELVGPGPRFLTKDSVVKIRRIPMPSILSMMARRIKRRHTRDPGSGRKA